jgi:hypothetical protein
MLKSFLLCSLLTAGLLVADDASAFHFGTPAQEHPYRSPQNFALEIRVSPYSPQVDDEPGLKGTPFKDRFGDSPRILLGLEFDWQAFRIPYVGTLGPGAGIGHVSMSRNAYTKENPPRPSGDDYSLTIYPLYVAAVLRVDTFWRGPGFPLIPYAKLGLGVGLWSADNAGNTSRSEDGVKGSGASFGTLMALGAMFPLDFLDKGASRNLDNAAGINTTSLFFEYYRLGLNGLAQDHALYVGSNTWAAGMTFEF